jgi:hypothetical protein
MSELKLTRRLPDIDSARLRPSLRERALKRPPLSTRGITIVRDRGDVDVRPK